MACTKCGATKENGVSDYLLVDGVYVANTEKIVTTDNVKMFRLLYPDGTAVWVKSKTDAQDLKRRDNRRIYESYMIGRL